MVSVSIIVPCYNEERTIRLLLEAIFRQSFPLSEMEVIIADGFSSDETRSVISRFQSNHPDLAIKIIDNPKKHIPCALNVAIASSMGEYIVRLDAHSIPHPDYIEKCIANLKLGLGDNVGGVWEIQPANQSWIARSIAQAASHPLGVGDAFYRFTTTAGLVDTVPFGAFKKSLFERTGYFDESLITNEDYEFNTRLRKMGGKIWLNPQIRTAYIARSNIKSLARQYNRYGFWKWQMLKRYPASLRWRQALPPLFVIFIILTLLLSFFNRLALWAFILGVGIYIFTLILASIPLSIKNKDIRLLAGIPLAISIMHICWGSSFLGSMLKSGVDRIVHID